MSEFPVGWFYIQCPTRQDQVLTVANMTMQPSTRVELRPKKTGANHQLWCYNQGYLVNKHSGCVLGAEKEKFSGQHVFQSRSSLIPSDHKKQIWKYDQYKRLLLTDDNDEEFALNDMAVPKLVQEKEKASSWIFISFIAE